MRVCGFISVGENKSVGGNKLKKHLGFAKRGIMCLSLISAISQHPHMANAGEITLIALNDTTNIVGDFIEFKDGNYVINTELGELKFSAKGVYCEGADCPEIKALIPEIHFIGSNTLGQGLMPLLIEGYANQLNAELTISDRPAANEIKAELISDNGYGEDIGSYLVSSQTTESGFAEFITQKNAVTMASRQISPTEARTLRRAGKGNMVNADQEHVIAMDSLVVIVNPDNPVSSISIADLKAIYSGTITNWAQLGGEDRPITVLAHRESSGARSLFNTAIFGNLAPPTLETATTGPDDSAIAKMVNENPDAIGFVGYAFQSGTKPLNLISACGIIHSPDPFSVKAEEYMFKRWHYLYIANDASQSIRDFISFATSTDADTLIAKSGFIDFGISKRPQTMDGLRARALRDANVDAFEGSVIDEMLDGMKNTSRLSSTIRFRDGSSRHLDELGLQTLQRLADYLQDLPAGTKVTLAGFTDDVGKFNDNRRLSNRRAIQVTKLLREIAGNQLTHIEIAAAGYGELSPSACNSSESGRRINRRVEVWISL